MGDQKRFRLKPALFFSAAVAALCLATGCAAPKHHDAIFFVTNTQVGVKIGADAYQRPTVEVGYNRQEGAVVPLYIANAEKYVSNKDPFIAGILERADKSLGQASDAGDKNAASLVKSALNFYRDGDAPSPVLLSMDKELALLVKESDPGKKAEKRALIKDFIRVESQKTALIARFTKDAKYVAREKGIEKTDAYSVFGTFSGQTGASSDATINTGTATAAGQDSPNAKASFKGGVMQSFATGVAAQIWAAQGAGITGGTPKEFRLISEFDHSLDQGIKNAPRKGELADSIMAIIFPGNEKDTAKETEYRKILDPDETNTDLYDKIFAGSANLRSYLLGSSFTAQDLAGHLDILSKE
ncbi:MAG: hypothetical protein HUN04_11885 [Desulfobacter sp.]|nr:MAG: hypothetical protein HUN04_11885 [Desulfobacter sp.]